MHFKLPTYYSLFILSAIGLFSACGIRQMLPKQAVWSQKKRDLIFKKENNTAGVNYTSTRYKTLCPVLPFQVWAATYDLDIVIVSEHEEWNMHEYACVATPNGAVWLMKDAREGSLDQCLIANLPDLDYWLPELPVERKSAPVKVIDKSSYKRLDFQFEYENLLGEKVEASYTGKRIKTPMKKRNGSTMGHSRNQAMAVLDLPYRNFGKKARIKFNGKEKKIKRLLGILPFCMALQQTQGGLSVGTFQLEHISDTLLQSSHPIKDSFAVQKWYKYALEDSLLCIEQKGNFRTIRYFVSLASDKLEIKAASVQQWNSLHESFRIEFERPLPDLRYPFRDTFSTRFVLDIGTQKSHGIGRVETYWQDEQIVLNMIPTAPWWVADRPMKTIVEILDGKRVRVNIRRVKLQD